MPAAVDAPPNVSTAWYQCKQQLRKHGVELKGYKRSGSLLFKRMPCRYVNVLPLHALSEEQLRLTMNPQSMAPSRSRRRL